MFWLSTNGSARTAFSRLSAAARRTLHCRMCTSSTFSKSPHVSTERSRTPSQLHAEKTVSDACAADPNTGPQNLEKDNSVIPRRDRAYFVKSGFSTGSFQTLPHIKDTLLLPHISATHLLNYTGWSVKNGTGCDLTEGSSRKCATSQTVPNARFHSLSKRHLTSHTPSVISARSISKWIVDESPPSIKPYLLLVRAHQPTGTWLLFLPCAWSISLAAAPGHLPDLQLLALFGLGSVLMRSAGCIINDMWDRDLDKQVTRTKDRPLAAGTLTYAQAGTVLVGCLTASLGVLLSLNTFSIGLGFSIMGLVIAYPLMKRYTNWPQLVLGLTFNWGALLGWAAVNGSLDWPVVGPLYAAGIFYTLLYDTVYAYQDRADDVVAGIKSSAVALRGEPRPFLMGCMLGMLVCLYEVGNATCQAWPYYGAVFVSSVLIVKMVEGSVSQDPAVLHRTFRSSKNLGLVILAGIVLGTLCLPTTREGEIERMRKQTKRREMFRKFVYFGDK